MMARGATVVDAIAVANRVAAISVQGEGTQTSFPSADNVPGGLDP